MPRLWAVWVGALLAGVCLMGGGLSAVAARAGGAGNRGILFAHGPRHSGEGGDLYVWSSGSRPRRLTASSDPKTWPRWSPSGSRIAFQMVPGWNGRGSCQACTNEIFVMRPDGSDQIQLTSDVERDGGVTGAVEPSWSPDGSRIVFTREFANRGNELVVISVRSRRERVLQAPCGNDPVWGSRGIAYVFRGGRGADGTAIRLLDPKTDRSKVLALTPAGVTEGGASALAWSPSGSELAALEGEFGRRIFVYSSSGRPIAKFKPPARGLDVFGVTWSPDGRHLLLTVGNHWRSPYWRLYQVDPSGKHWERLPLEASSPPTSWR